MIEMNSHIGITLCGFDHGGVERGAPDRVDVFVRVAVVRGEDRARSGARGMDHATAHRDGVLKYFIGDAELFERMNSTRGECEVDRSAADKVAFARIRPAFVKIDIVPAPPQVRGEQSAG